MKKKYVKGVLISISFTLLSVLILGGCSFKKDKNADNDNAMIDNAFDFIEAIQPGATINLAKGNYNLTEAIEEILEEEDMDDWNDNHDYVEIIEDFDGFGLKIYDVDNLTIVGEKRKSTELQIEPRYSDVLNFEDCKNINISNLTMGHTPDKGSCAGDVLEFSECENINLDNLDLYGCGTYGITAMDTENLTLTDSRVHDCSYGAFWWSRCDGFVISDCIIDENEEYTILDVNNTQAEFKDCIFDNNFFTWDFVNADAGNELNFTGCDFGYNESFSLETNSTGCTFDDNCTFAVIDEVGIDPVYDNIKYVYSMQEFIDAIAPNTTIYVEPGIYNISEYLDDLASDYGVEYWNTLYEYVDIELVFDGTQLDISNVPNLCIYGDADDRADVEFITEPRYADVLHFENCDYLDIENLTMGHTDTGNCAGDVIGLYNCNDAFLNNMDLYGCGVYGIGADNTVNISVNDSRIHDCYYGFANYYYCRGSLQFNNCSLDNSEGGLNAFNSDTVVFNSCYFGYYEQEYIYDNDTELNDCTFADYNSYGANDSLTSIDISEDIIGVWTAYKVIDVNGEVTYLEYDDYNPTVELSIEASKGYIKGYVKEDQKDEFTYEYSDDSEWLVLHSDKYGYIENAMIFAYMDEDLGRIVLELDIDNNEFFFY